MKSKLVVGAGDFLEIAFQAWRTRAPEIVLEKLEVNQDDSYHFDLSFLDRYSPQETSMFAAFGNHFLNFKRLELMGAIKSRGFHMDPFVDASAIVASEAKVGENSFISAGATIAAGATLHYNVFVGARTVIGYAAEIGHSTWIEAATVIGRKSRVGPHTTIGPGVILADEAEFGRLCVIDRPGVYRGSVTAKTYFLPEFELPVRIYK